MGKPVGSAAKTTRWAWSKQTPDGILSSGGLAEDQVKHAWQLMNAYDPRHYIVMESDGKRKGRTTIESPGGMTLKVGQDMQRGPSEKGPDGQTSRGNQTLNIQVENGNLNIDCQNGDLNVIARNINFTATGDDSKEGNFSVRANNKISLDCQQYVYSSKQSITICAANMLRLQGTRELQLIGGITTMFTESTRRGKKPDIWPEGEPIPAAYSEKVENANVAPERMGAAAIAKVEAAASALAADTAETLANYTGV